MHQYLFLNPIYYFTLRPSKTLTLININKIKIALNQHLIACRCSGRVHIDTTTI